MDPILHSVINVKNQNGPREKILTENGGRSLSDSELLCIFMRTGGRGYAGQTSKVSQLAQEMLERLGGLNGIFQAGRSELFLINGLGPAKVAEILALRELLDRLNRQGAPTLRVKSVNDAYQLFAPMADAEQEIVSAAFLTTRNRLIQLREIFKGTLSHSPACPREILRAALRVNAAKLIVAHNHPSGECDPSEEDIAFTLQLDWSSEAVGIPLVDHLIIGAEGRYYSFAQAKRLGKQNLPLVMPSELRPHAGVKKFGPQSLDDPCHRR